MGWGVGLFFLELTGQALAPLILIPIILLAVMVWIFVSSWIGQTLLLLGGVFLLVWLVRYLRREAEIDRGFSDGVEDDN